MRTIAVVFAAVLALGAAMPAAQAAQQDAGTSLKLQAEGLIHSADEFSSRRRGWRGHRGWHRHGWHGRRWHVHRRWVGHRHWRAHRYWGWRGYGWRRYGWYRHRHCWRVWYHGRRVVVCRWRRW